MQEHGRDVLRSSRATEYPGSVTGLVNRSGSVVNEYRYDPWGTLQTLAEGTPNPLRFHAREADPQTGLYYVRARWYDPELARFVSEDPLGLEGGLNPYVFAGNSPVNVRDPSGLQPPTLPWGVSLDGLVAVAPARDWAAFLRQLATGGAGRGYGPGIFGSGAGGGGWGGGGDIMNTPIDLRGIEEGKAWQRRYHACLASIGFATANVALDVSGTRLAIAAGVQGIQIASAGRGMGDIAWQVFSSKLGRAFSPTPFSVTANSAAAVTGALFSGSANGLTLLKYAAGFVPVVGSGVAIYDAIQACRAVQ